MMKQYTNIKIGFSLIEALVSMLIISIFFIASSRVITQKQKAEVQENPHGYYECYIIDNLQWQHRSMSGAATARVNTNNCIFDPPSGVNFVNIHYFNGTQYYNSQQVILNERITLGGPSGIERDGVFVKNSESGEALDMQPVGENGVNEFRTYLRMVHPSSNLYDFWVNQNNQLQSAVLISW